MPPSEQVHIISAGENIHIAYPAIFRMLPTITQTYVIADNSVYELSSNPEVEKTTRSPERNIEGKGDLRFALHSILSRTHLPTGLPFRPRQTHEDPLRISRCPVYIRSLGWIKTTLHGALCHFVLAGWRSVLCIR